MSVIRKISIILCIVLCLFNVYAMESAEVESPEIIAKPATITDFEDPKKTECWKKIVLKTPHCEHLSDPYKWQLRLDTLKERTKKGLSGVVEFIDEENDLMGLGLCDGLPLSVPFKLENKSDAEKIVKKYQETLEINKIPYEVKEASNSLSLINPTSKEIINLPFIHIAHVKSDYLSPLYNLYLEYHINLNKNVVIASLYCPEHYKHTDFSDHVKIYEGLLYYPDAYHPLRNLVVGASPK